MTTRICFPFAPWGWLQALLLMLVSLLGCGSSSSQCPVDSCLEVELVGSPVRALSTVEILLRDDARLTRHLFVGSELTEGSTLHVPISAVMTPTARRALYVRASLDDTSGPHELLGLTEGTRAGLSRAVVTLSPGCERPPCATPGPRRGAALTYSPATHQVLLHGGEGPSGRLLDDMWAWNGLWWQQLTAMQGPSARSQHGFAFDPASGKVVLFGGQGAGGVLADTWLLDPASLTWQKVTTSAPPGRRLAALGASPVGSGRGLALFGGQDGAGSVLGDTWLWDGVGWQPGPSSLCPVMPLAAATAPRCRVGATLVPRADGHESLLIGGWLGPQPASIFEADEVIWRFGGADWSVAPISRPPFLLARYRHGAASLVSAAGKRGIWTGFGESAVGLRQDSYLIDETSGQVQPLLGQPPSPRTETAITFDGEREEVVLFGGRSDAGLLGETYTLTLERGYRQHR